MRYKQKRFYEWGHDIAYIVGLMASDGCLSSDGRHLDLTSIDMEQLINFSKALKRDFTISEKHNTSDVTAYRIQFSDVALYDFLQKAGLTPRKSLTISSINIPDDYYADFLRGVFDGDGTAYGFWDKRWKSSYMYYVSFASASLQFLDYLRQENTRLATTKTTSISLGTRAFKLSYSKADTKLLYRFMYYDESVIHLYRKRKKIEDFFITDKNDMLT